MVLKIVLNSAGSAMLRSLCGSGDSMIELRIELQPSERRPVRSSSRLFCSSHRNQRETAFRGPVLPRSSATLEEDVLEFGAVRLREIEF